MLIYNVTTNVETTIEAKWLLWMRNTHIPAILETGLFLSAKLSKVLVKEDMGGVSYSVQFSIEDRGCLQQFYDQYLIGFEKIAQRQFPNKFVAFSTELEVISEH